MRWRVPTFIQYWEKIGAPILLYFETTQAPIIQAG